LGKLDRIELWHLGHLFNKKEGLKKVGDGTDEAIAKKRRLGTNGNLHRIMSVDGGGERCGREVNGDPRKYCYSDLDQLRETVADM